MGFLLTAFVGHALFAIAMGQAVYPLALSAEVLYGVGIDCITVVQRSVVAKVRADFVDCWRCVKFLVVI